MSATPSFRIWSVLFLISLMPFSAAAQQTSHQHAHETDSRIAVLNDFHEVIFQIWHTAWPEGNVAMLSDLLPQVKQYTDTLSRVTLPGILRDKQEPWAEGIAKLKSIVGEYKAATAPLDSLKLLDAAERLHSQYESLARIIRPVTKELDQFHQILYMIYHHYWPNKDLEKLVLSVASLKEKMAALSSSKLPNRLKQKEEAFAEAKANLSRAVDMLVASDADDNPEKFASDLEMLHSRYQALEKVFE